MENKTTILDPLLERAEIYGKTRIELFKLKAVDKTTKVISPIVSRIIAISVLTFFLLMLNIGVALWLGDLLGKMYYGFLCVAIFYGIIGGVLFFFMHTWLKKQVSNSIIKQMLN